MARRPPSPLRLVAVTLAAALVALGQVAAAEGPLRLTDVTAATGLDFVQFNGMVGDFYFSEMMGSGGALVDYDRDGDLDLYLVQGAMLDPGQSPQEALVPPVGEPIDRLYRTDLVATAGGSIEPRFVDVTATIGLRETGYGMGVAVGDVDNDGWPDLYVLNLGRNRLLRNLGDGTFAEVADQAGVDDGHWGVSASFVDHDRDGWLDLYVANYVDYSLATHKQCVSPGGVVGYCGPLAFAPDRDVLYRNRGDGTFENATRSSGVASVAYGALGVVAFDADDDGWLDLYVANDQVPNVLWMNQHDGTFVDDSLLSGTQVNDEGLSQASMGLVAGDFDLDGDEDLFMSHITRDTNTMYRNDGTGLFDDSTRQSGLGMESWEFTGFGIAASDFDRDGLIDFFIANGAVAQLEELTASADPYKLAQTDQLFHNQGGGRWTEVTAEAGEALAVAAVGRGVTQGDLDLDGDEDLLLVDNNGPARILRNDSPPRGGWLAVDVLLAPGGRAALGAPVRVADGRGTSLRRRVATDGSYASARAARVLVGLGEMEPPLDLRVDWPTGGTTIWQGVPAGRALVVAPGRPPGAS